MNDAIGMILAKQAAMEAMRDPWLQHWRECAELMLPRQDDFFGKRQPGEKRTQKIFDSTAMYAVDRGAGVMESILTPRTQIWHKLKPKGMEAQEGGPIGEWYDALNQALFDRRYSPKAAFASNAHEAYMSLLVFGTAAIYIASAPGAPLWYRNCHLSEIYFAEDAYGRVDTVYRKYTMTARQVMQAFPEDRIPAKVKDLADKKPDTAEIVVLHCTSPNPDPVPGREDASGMPWKSVYVLPEHHVIVDEGGYWSFPWAIPRYVTAPREIFGRSPGMAILPDAKMLNEAAKSRAKSWHYANDPSLLIADDGVLSPVNVRPGALIAGGVDENGRPRIVPLQNGARLDIDEAMTEQIRAGIRAAFLIDIIQVLNDKPNMTAYEAGIRAQEKGQIMAPVMGRQHSEFLGPLIEREIDLLARANLLPPVPPELLEMGGEYEIEYLSPLSTAARAEPSLALQRSFMQAAPFIELDPTAGDWIDAEDAVKTIMLGNGSPNSAIRGAEAVDAIRQQRAQQQAMQMAMQAGPAMAQTVGGMAKAVA
jgi:hypothetical protein